MKQIILNKIKKTLNEGYFDYTINIGGVRNFLSKILHLRKSGSFDTRYTQPITLSNNETLTIRLSNHKASEQNFITHNNTNKNISIIISPDDNNVIITREIPTSQIYEEIFYSSECFNKQNIKQALTEILQGFEYALENNGRFKKGELGEYIIQREMKNTEQKGLGFATFDDKEQCRTCKHSIRNYNNDLFCKYGNIPFTKVFCLDYDEKQSSLQGYERGDCFSCEHLA